jgi:hypothetical protein
VREVQAVTDLLTDLEALRESFLKEARIYSKQGAVPDGARPHQITPWQLACGYMAGDYRIAAHEVNKILKKHKKNTSVSYDGPKGRH